MFPTYHIDATVLVILIFVPGTFKGRVSHVADVDLQISIDSSSSGTFQTPSANVRPKFRYWLPDASVDTSVVSSDVAEMGAKGAGGAELLGYYETSSPSDGVKALGPTDWTVYGFGTDAWASVFAAFAQAHEDNGLLMDFAIGPGTASGVPLPDDDAGLTWDLLSYHTTVPVRGSFDSTLPGWGAGTLEAAVVGLATNSVVTSSPDGVLPGDYVVTRTEVTLAASSLLDVTAQVDDDGVLRIDFSNDTTTDALNHTIFAIYAAQPGYRTQVSPEDLRGPQSVPATFRQNGSYTVDHFSRVGAAAVTSFWDTYLLSDSTRALLSSVGNVAWEDSVEIDAHVYWTQNLSQIFARTMGYSLTEYMPLLLHSNSRVSVSTGSTWWRTDEADGGNSHVLDYRSVLATQYREYLAALNEWSESLDIQFSAQVSYNLPMDMLSNVPAVDVPEFESLDFNDMIDSYRQYAGPANLAQKPILSSELGASRGQSYTQTVPNLLWHMQRSWVGSANQYVLHGYPYSGDYPNTTWPVFTTFNYAYSQMWGPHEPCWAFLRPYMDYVARINWVTRAGATQRDVAIWQMITAYPYHVRSRTYLPDDLEKQGYTYEYISPNNLDLDTVIVRDGVLAPDAQNFKAFVIRGNDTLTMHSVDKLASLAETGLVLVFSGSLPTYIYDARTEAETVHVQAQLKNMATLDNVHVLDSYDHLAASLADLDITPATSLSTNGSWFTIWRRDAVMDVDYFLVYSDAAGQSADCHTAGTVTFSVTGTPYAYDPWTGTQTPVAVYNASSTATTIPFRLYGSQLAIVAFRHDDDDDDDVELPMHLTAASDGVLAAANSADNDLATVSCGPGSDCTVAMCTGQTHTLAAAPAAAFTLTNWSLTVEHWDPPADLANISGGAYRYNSTHALPLLLPWSAIAGLANTSGVGYYTTTFDWPPEGWTAPANVSGAYIDFGRVLHTLQASVNGYALPPLDVARARADIGSFLVDGANTVEAVVSTPLGNVLATVWAQVQAYGTGPADVNWPAPATAAYGLQQDVVVTPYLKHDLKYVVE